MICLPFTDGESHDSKKIGIFIPSEFKELVRQSR